MNATKVVYSPLLQVQLELFPLSLTFSSLCRRGRSSPRSCPRLAHLNEKLAKENASLLERVRQLESALEASQVSEMFLLVSALPILKEVRSVEVLGVQSFTL